MKQSASAEYTRLDHREDWYLSAMEYLVVVVQDLSHARDLPTVIDIVRRAARELTGADGSTFVLRDEDKCYYVDEDALEPLWKGSRFPMSICISGWVMLNAKSVVIDDVFQDSRIPADVYRKTFVKSMAMVPIRADDPIGAIGIYWARHRHPEDQELKVLEALANVTAVTMENIDLYEKLQRKIGALKASNEELERFAWAVSHDLKSPLQAIENLAEWIAEEVGENATESGNKYLELLKGRVRRLGRLLRDILDFSRVEHQFAQDNLDIVEGTQLIEDIGYLIDFGPFTLRSSDSFLKARFQRAPMTRILLNLIGNSINHHDRSSGTIEVYLSESGGKYVISVTDDGPGIPWAYSNKIFDIFQTIQPRDAVEGSGMGLAVVKKIISFYDSKVWVERNDGRGATISFTWPKELMDSSKEKSCH